MIDDEGAGRLADKLHEVLQSMMLIAQGANAVVFGWQLSETWVMAPSSPPVECRSALTSQNIRMVAR
jgi:hypothetical protein